MSGPRPTHLARRGAVYVARFRIPLKLVDRLGMVELCRSLYTPDAKLARSRCLRATNWFRLTMDGLLQMSNPTRADLEKSARQFFEELKAENDVPRQFQPESLDEELELNLDLSRRRIRDLDDQLKVNKFKGYVEGIAMRLVAEMGAKMDDLTAGERLITLQLAARVDRERQEHFMHLLTTPAQQYVPRDSLFGTPEIDQSWSEQIAYPANSILLSKAGAEYLKRKTSEGVGASLLTELKRVLMWFQERVGADQPLKAITKAELRAFRDDLGKIDVQLRGRKLLFEDRLTNKGERQIKSVTARRYWQSIQGFFRWAEDEGHITVDPAAGLKMAVKKGQVKRSPAPFDQEELKKFCQSPLYSGYLSTKRVSTPGDFHIREGKWWSGILMMFTGMRAAEVSQLLPSDFVFDHEVPHLKIQRVDANGKQVKTVKSDSSLRDVPLAPQLLVLGLRQFIERRAKLKPSGRIFLEFRPGLDRLSDGATKFWGNYLRKVGLWKEGRATHVWRHTLIATLRSNGVAEEDIQAVVGHARQTVTAGYGGAYPLSRKFDTVLKLEFGFDVVLALGGAFDKKLHM